MKKILSFIRLEIESGKASPSPPVGPALGLRGVNIMQFCKEFNNICRNENIKEGIPIPTIITVYDDKTFTFKINTPSTPYMLKQVTSIKKGSTKPGHDTNIDVDIRTVYEIAKLKGNNISIRSKCKSIISTAKSIGMLVKW